MISRGLLALIMLGCGATISSAMTAAHADESARALFITNCAQCHMADARGTPGVAPPLRYRVARFARIPGGWRYLSQVVTFGLSGPIEAEGAHYDGYMPSFAMLAAADRAMILNYVAGLSPSATRSAPITPSEVEDFTLKSVPSSTLRRERAALRTRASSALPRARSSSDRAPGEFVLSGPRLAYVRNCAGCHLLSGEGIPSQVPRLRAFVGYFMRTPAGRAYVVRLPDIAYSPLSNVKLARLLNWVVRRFSAAQLPLRFDPYTAKEVAALRAEPLSSISPTRARVPCGVLQLGGSGRAF
jgi:mono/diheme cytochrome c family protein